MTNLEKLLLLKNAHASEGIQGEQGPTGPQGIQGEQGPKGEQGPQGVQGVQGPAGTNGVGITLLGTVALIVDLPTEGNTQGDTYIVTETGGHGYTWNSSLESWKDIGHIQGPQGIQGIQGEQGEKGDQGEQGPQGVQGIQGVQGVQGEKGDKGDKGEQGVAGLSVNVTTEGGFYINLINKTGGVSVKGTVVEPSSTIDLAVNKIQQGIPDPIGVIYEDGVADGELVKVVISGIADVLFIGSTTRHHFARGFVAAEAGFVAGKAISESIPTSPFATDKHFYEIGHVLESRDGAGLAKVMLHFN